MLKPLAILLLFWIVILTLDEYTKAVTEIGIKDLQARQVIIDYWKLNESDKKLFLSFIQRFVTIKKQED